MKTKLEIGKEYWLSGQLNSRGVFVGYNAGRMPVFRITKSHQYIANEGAIESFSSDMNCYSEYIPEKPWSFTTPIAMKCTEEQFNDIKDKLVEMGYSGCQKTISFDKYGYLTNRYGTIGNVDCTDKYISKSKVSNWFESFTPDLFLALAAMTDKEDGIKGEWWKAKAGVEFHVQQGGEVCGLTRAFFRKATAQEIIEHFEKKGKKEADRIFKLVLDFQSSLFNNINEDKTIIPIPPTKQATLFDDRVEITDWKPKEGDFVFYIAYWNDEFRYTNTLYNDNFKKEFNNGFIKRTESEAKQLVEKLKQAML